MQITAVRLLQLTGVMEHEGQFWEERLIRPVDIYPEHKDEARRTDKPDAGDTGRDNVPITAYFVRIETDDGVYGIGGPFAHEQAYIIGKQLAPILMGHDPLAIERLWDRMYRFMVHGRKGLVMHGNQCSGLCAFWDLKGKHFNAPCLPTPWRTHPHRNPRLCQRTRLFTGSQNW